MSCTAFSASISNIQTGDASGHHQALFGRLDRIIEQVRNNRAPFPELARIIRQVQKEQQKLAKQRAAFERGVYPLHSQVRHTEHYTRQSEAKLGRLHFNRSRYAARSDFRQQVVQGYRPARLKFTAWQIMGRKKETGGRGAEQSTWELDIEPEVISEPSDTEEDDMYMGVRDSEDSDSDVKESLMGSEDVVDEEDWL